MIPFFWSVGGIIVLSFWFRYPACFTTVDLAFTDIDFLAQSSALQAFTWPVG